MRIYLDTAPIIYVVEQVEPYVALLDRRLGQASVELLISDLTRLECRVKPIRLRDAALLADYDQFFAEAVSAIVPLTAEVMDIATEIRATYGFRTPDAIHLAATTEAQCEIFLTNDVRLQRYTSIPVHILSAG